ncbi:hypothetical protein LCGC14_0953110 [marine sediment metagenome]|uniref:Uncharacterized protein n=1 Tax=marine sediment metagenome TaxID=412755 RepID=A0A0F9NGM0_9ZZZZ
MTEKRYNAAEVLGKVSGLGSGEVDRIFEEVKANHAKLDACDGHDFEPCERIGELVRSYKCMRCFGVLDAVNRRWYECGRVHGAQGRQL